MFEKMMFHLLFQVFLLYFKHYIMFLKHYILGCFGNRRHRATMPGSKPAQPPLAEEASLVVPVEWINKGQGVAIDIGRYTRQDRGWAENKQHYLIKYVH